MASFHVAFGGAASIDTPARGLGVMDVGRAVEVVFALPYTTGGNTEARGTH